MSDWTIADVYRRAETGQFVLTLERDSEWASVDVTVSWRVEKRWADLAHISVDWVKRATPEVEREVTAWVMANAEDAVFDAVLSAEAA